MRLTKAQREYTQRYITVQQSPKQQRDGSGLTVYLVTHNPLMATFQRKIIATTKSYAEAALIAQGYSKGEIKLAQSVQEILGNPILMRLV